MKIKAFILAILIGLTPSLQAFNSYYSAGAGGFAGVLLGWCLWKFKHEQWENSSGHKEKDEPKWFEYLGLGAFLGCAGGFALHQILSSAKIKKDDADNGKSTEEKKKKELFLLEDTQGKAEREKKEKEQKEEKEREQQLKEQQRLDQERIRIEQERIQKEKEENERKRKEQQRLDQERIRIEQVRIQKENEENERKRKEQQRLEQERIRIEQERIQKEKEENERKRKQQEQLERIRKEQEESKAKQEQALKLEAALNKQINQIKIQDVTNLLQNDAPVSSLEVSRKLLALACQRRNTQLLQLSLDKGADSNAKNDAGRTPLMQAIINGWQEGVQELIKKANINATDNRGYTPLHEAVERRNDEIAKLLIQAKADLSIKNISNETPFDMAIENKNEGLIILMLEKIKSETVRANALKKAVEYDNLDGIKLLVKNGVDINSTTFETKSTVLHIAAKAGKFEIAKGLLSLTPKSSLDSEKKTPLMIAAESGNAQLVELFANHFPQDVNSSQSNFNALSLAAQSGSKEAVMTLLINKANTQAAYRFLDVKNYEENLEAQQLIETCEKELFEMQG